MGSWVWLLKPPCLAPSRFSWVDQRELRCVVAAQWEILSIALIGSAATRIGARRSSGASKGLRCVISPATSQTSPIHEPWSSPAHSFSSNQTRRGGKLFHENCDHRCGEALENFGRSAGQLRQRPRAPGQTAAGPALTGRMSTRLTHGGLAVVERCARDRSLGASMPPSALPRGGEAAWSASYHLFRAARAWREDSWRA